MAVKEMLALGRAVGLENFSQIRRVVHNLSKGAHLKQNLRLVFDMSDIERMVKYADSSAPVSMRKSFPSAVRSMQNSRSYMPALYMKGNQHIIDISGQNIAKNCTVLRVNAKTVSQEGKTLAQISSCLSTSPAIVISNLVAKIQDLTASLRVSISSYTGVRNSAKAIAKGVQYSEKGNMASVSLPLTNIGVVKAEGHVTAPIDLLNHITKNISNCRLNSVASLIDFIKIL